MSTASDREAALSRRSCRNSPVNGRKELRVFKTVLQVPRGDSCGLIQPR